eukprot:15358706-Heterocapsa_arctica.AAC.1
MRGRVRASLCRVCMCAACMLLQQSVSPRVQAHPAGCPLRARGQMCRTKYGDPRSHCKLAVAQVSGKVAMHGS